MKKYFNVINTPFQLSYCIHSETLQLTIHKIKYLATQWNDEEFFVRWEVPQIIGTTSAMWISDFEIFAKNLFYTWGTKGFHQKKSLGCAKNSFYSDV